MAPAPYNTTMKQQLRRFLPIIISGILIIILIGYAPWSQVLEILADLDATTIALLVGLSLLYYAIKVIRFWYMLRTLGIHQPLRVVTQTYMAAQPVTLLPAGEIYRCRMLERYTGVPMKDSLPTFTSQGLFEGAGMAAVGIVCALSLGQLRFPVITLGVIVVLAGVAIRMGYLHPLLRLIDKLPLVSISHNGSLHFSTGNAKMLKLPYLPIILGMSIIGEILGGLIAYVSVVGLDGHINLATAMLVYIIPMVVGFLSLLPGGLGASEQSAVGLLLIAGTGVALAVAATLLMRVTIVGLGVLYGGGFNLWLRLRHKEAKLV